jgi:D-cysteine desulfhydrase
MSFKRIVFATSSGGTQAGLVLGAKLRNWHGEILGISIDQVPDEQESNPQLKYVKHMVDISNQALKKLGSRIFLSASDFNVNYDYLQDGYGVVGDYDRIGVRTLSNHGILAGPVYSGRAFGALLDLISKGVIPDDGQTLFWHTGGAGEIEVYKDEIYSSSSS